MTLLIMQQLSLIHICVKIENAAGADVTANYDITMVNGNLKITHDAALALSLIHI